MKQKFILLLFSIISINAFSQDDHLEPVSGYFDLYEYKYQYYSNIKSILFKDLYDSPEIRYFVRPSFTPEYVLQIEYNREKKIYYIVFHKAQKSIWYTKKKKSIKVKKTRKKISKKDVELIKKLYINAIKKTKYGQKDISYFDGITYTFTVANKGLKSGETHSPKQNTKMYELIQINEKIIKDIEGIFVGLSPSIKKRIKKLSDKIALSK